MGLLTLLLKLPFLPLLEVIRIAEIIQEETERQLHDPARARRELEEAQQQYAAGGMSEDELSRVEYTAASRLFPGVSVSQGQQPASRRRRPPSRRQPRIRRQTRTGGDRHG